MVDAYLPDFPVYEHARLIVARSAVVVVFRHEVQQFHIPFSAPFQTYAADRLIWHSGKPGCHSQEEACVIEGEAQFLSAETACYHAPEVGQQHYVYAYEPGRPSYAMQSFALCALRNQPHKQAGRQKES